jgi:hypothetical protein
MKITKTQLKQIIKEELNYALWEKKNKKDKKIKWKSSEDYHRHQNSGHWRQPERANYRGDHDHMLSRSGYPLFPQGSADSSQVSPPLDMQRFAEHFASPDYVGLGTAEEQYQEYLEVYDEAVAAWEATRAGDAERAAYRASPEGQAEDEYMSAMQGRY